MSIDDHKALVPRSVEACWTRPDWSAVDACFATRYVHRDPSQPQCHNRAGRKQVGHLLLGSSLLLAACGPAAPSTTTAPAATAGAAAVAALRPSPAVAPFGTATPVQPPPPSSSPAMPTSAATATPIPTLETGQKVDVGGYALWIQCTGQGSPAVVLDAGSATTSATWAKVQPQVASFTRVCVYDRAGLGHSDRGPRPTTSEQIVRALHALLANAGVGGPYVPVGHSLGGLNMYLFACLYPAEVVGLVEVDSVTPPDYLDPESTNPAFSSEQINLRESARQVLSAPPLPELPLIVLMHGKEGAVPAFAEKHWSDWQRDLASRSPQGKLIIAEQSGHAIQNDQPDLVVAAIREVVEQARRQSRRRIAPWPRGAGATRKSGPPIRGSGGT